MNTEQDNSIVEETPIVVAPGTILKQKRESLGLTQQQVADRLRLRVSIVQNLEANQFESDLVATFIRGYLRSYAKAVGVSEAEILDAYEKSTAVEPKDQPMQSFSKKTKRAKSDSNIMTITWVILAILLGMSSLWWWQNHRDSNFDASQDAEVSAVLDNEATLQDSTSGQEFATVNELTEENGEEPVEEVELQESVEEPVAVKETKPEPAVETPAVVKELLAMSFSADCWIQITDATGKTLWTGIRKSGQTLNLRGQKPLKVVLGAPEGVTMTFASEEIDLSGYTPGKVAKFTLP